MIRVAHIIATAGSRGNLDARFSDGYCAETACHLPRKASSVKKFMLILVLLTLSCGETIDPTEVALPSPQTAAGILQTAPDPCPECNGIYLSRSASSWINCALSPNVDADVDGVDDNCEHLLAAAFAPMMYMSPQDGCKSSEPYFAARRNDWMIEIIYLQSYHYDCGSLGHPGDSEWVSVNVYFNQDTGRWEFVSMTLSAHWNTANDQTYTYYSYEVWYPAQDGTPDNFGQSLKYPAVFSSRGKHANYRDRAYCEYFFSGDTCEDNVAFGRIYVDPSRNIGSRNHRMKDCVFSTQGYSGYECFWSGSTFRGWVGEGGDTGYGEILSAYGW